MLKQQRSPLKLIYFLTFDEASVKKQYEICNILNCIVCYTVFFSFWFFLDFFWSFSKKTGRSLWWHFNAKTVIQSSHFKLIISEFSWSFSKKLEEISICILMPGLWYNIQSIQIPAAALLRYRNGCAKIIDVGGQKGWILCPENLKSWLQILPVT